MWRRITLRESVGNNGNLQKINIIDPELLESCNIKIAENQIINPNKKKSNSTSKYIGVTLINGLPI